MARIRADDRVRRLLALIPWVTEHTPVAIEEVCGRFGLTRRELIEDLEILPFVGVPPYTPDTMIDVEIDGGLIGMRLSEPFHRPLRLTAHQALTLIAAGRGAKAVPGADPSDALQRALAKLGRSIGVDVDQIQVELGPVSPAILETVMRAVREHRSLEIDYVSLGRGERSTRTIDPYRAFSEGGAWYLLAWCHRSEDTRVFRLDRMNSAAISGDGFAPPELEGTPRRYEAEPDTPRVVIDLAPSESWRVDEAICEDLAELPDGRLRVRVAVSGRTWLEWLLLACGAGAALVSAPPELADCRSEAATRLLARYVVDEGTGGER